MKKTILVLVVVMMIHTSCDDYHAQNPTVVPQAASAKQLGTEHFTKGDYFKALDYYYKALDHYRILKDELQVSKVTSNIGSVYSKAGFHSIALSFYNDALTQRDTLNDAEGIANLYYNISRTLRNDDKNKEAKQYLILSDSIFDALDITKYKPRIYNDLGLTYANDSNYVEARKYFHKALDANHTREGMIYKNIGYSYHQEGNNDKALAYYNKALKLQDHLRPDVRTRLYHNMANLNKDQDSVAWYYTQGFNKDLIWIDELYIDAANALFKYYTSKHETKIAMPYHDFGYEAGKKLIKQRDELKRMYDLYQVKYAHYKEQSRQQAALVEQRAFQKLLINSVISGILFFIILYIVYRQKKLAKNLSLHLDNAPIRFR